MSMKRRQNAAAVADATTAAAAALAAALAAVALAAANPASDATTIFTAVLGSIDSLLFAWMRKKKKRS